MKQAQGQVVQAGLILALLLLLVPASAAPEANSSSGQQDGPSSNSDRNPASVGYWLHRMVEADSQLSYQGSFVYVRQAGDDTLDMDTFEITHLADQGVVRERLSSMSGPVREIQRHDDEIRSVFEHERTVMVDQQVRHGRYDRIPVDALLRGDLPYRASLGRRGRVAGRSAVELRLLPEDALRYGVTLWLDRQHALPLKTIVHAAGKRSVPLVKIMYTDIRFGDEVDRSRLDSDLPAAQFRTQTSPIPASRTDADKLTPRWQPRSLPVGFSLTYHDHEAAAGGQFEHLVYSDGLASVSIYVERLDDNEVVRVGHGRMGAMNAWIRQDGDFRITGLGEVPQETLQMMVEAVTAGPEAATESARETPAASAADSNQPGS